MTDIEMETQRLKGMSPSAEKRVLEHKLELEEYKAENELQSCCSNRTTDKRLLQYISKFALSVLTLSFASIQLIRASECDSLIPFYSSLITFVLGAWINETSDGKKNMEKSNK